MQGKDIDMTETIQTQDESNFHNALRQASYKAKDLLEIGNISSKANNQIISIIGQLEGQVSGFFRHKLKSPKSKETVNDLFESIQSNLDYSVKKLAEFAFNDKEKARYFTNEVHAKFLLNYNAHLIAQEI